MLQLLRDLSLTFTPSLRTALLSLVYLVLCFGLGLGVFLLLGAHEQSLTQSVLQFILPTDWVYPAELLLQHLLRTQSQEVLNSLALSLTMAAISLVGFWLKELLSQSVERDEMTRKHPQADSSKWRENALWWEALEETRWTALTLALTFVILYVGQDLAPWRHYLAEGLSYALLVLSGAVTFLAQPMQRRSLSYGQILGALLQHPLRTLCFGALVSLPQLGLLTYLGMLKLDDRTLLSVLFGVQVLFLLIGIPFGTSHGLRFIPKAKTISPLPSIISILLSAVVLCILALGSYITGQVLQSLVAKTQVLKCEYSIVPDTFAFDSPSAMALLAGEVRVGVRFTVDIQNPTTYDVRLEHTRIEVLDEGKLIAQGRLSPLLVPALGEARSEVGLELAIRASSLLENISLNPTKWGIQLVLELDSGIEFPVPLRLDYE